MADYVYVKTMNGDMFTIEGVNYAENVRDKLLLFDEFVDCKPSHISLCRVGSDYPLMDRDNMADGDVLFMVCYNSPLVRFQEMVPNGRVIEIEVTDDDFEPEFLHAGTEAVSPHRLLDQRLSDGRMYSLYNTCDVMNPFTNLNEAVIRRGACYEVKYYCSIEFSFV
jgi:hypothetical protein